MRERRRHFFLGGVPSSATHRVRRHVHVRGGVDAREHRGGRGEGGFGRHEVRAVIAGDARVDGRARGDQGVERRAAVDAGHVHEIGVERGDFRGDAFQARPRELEPRDIGRTVACLPARRGGRALHGESERARVAFPAVAGPRGCRGALVVPRPARGRARGGEREQREQHESAHSRLVLECPLPGAGVPRLIDHSQSHFQKKCPTRQEPIPSPAPPHTSPRECRVTDRTGSPLRPRGRARCRPAPRHVDARARSSVRFSVRTSASLSSARSGVRASEGTCRTPWSGPATA